MRNLYEQKDDELLWNDQINIKIKQQRFGEDRDISSEKA